MSRIGKMPIQISKDVSLTLEGNLLSIEGPKGKLNHLLPKEIKAQLEGNELYVKRNSDEPRSKALHGLTRTLIANMVNGVSEGWKKTLELVGTGFRAKKEGEDLILTLGFSHPVKITPPAGIDFKIVEGKIEVWGIDKAVVGQTAATIRAIKPPEPYKGKGIRYQGEIVRRKAGKAAKIGSGTGGGK